MLSKIYYFNICYNGLGFHVKYLEETLKEVMRHE